MNKINYMTSLLTFYLKGEISHEQNFVKIKRPNTILALIPLGSKTETVAINQIASVETNFSLFLKELIYGVLIAIIGFCCMSISILLGLLLVIWGVSMGLCAFQTDLIIRLTSSSIKKISFLVLEKKKAYEAAEQINQLIGNRLDDTNTRQQTDRIVDAITSSNK